MPPFPLRTVSRQIVAATTAFTTSYVAALLVSTDEANCVCFDITYTIGDETSIQWKVESTNDEGALSATTSDWYQQITQTASGGTVTVAPAVYSMTTSGLPATQKITVLINPAKGTGFKLSVKSTGGTPTGTYSVKAYTGWV